MLSVDMLSVIMLEDEILGSYAECLRVITKHGRMDKPVWKNQDGQTSIGKPA